MTSKFNMQLNTQWSLPRDILRLFGLGCYFVLIQVSWANSILDPVLPPLAAVKQTLADNPSVRAAISDQDYASFAGQDLKLGQNPWTVRTGMQLRKTDAPVDQGKSNSYEPNFAIEKKIRLPSKYQLDQDLAQRGIQIAELKYEDAKHEAAKTLLVNWFSYMRSALQLTRLQQQLEQLQQYMLMTQQRIQAGDAPRLELMLLNNEYNQIDEKYMQAKAIYDQAQQQLARDYRGAIPQQWNSDIIKVETIQHTQAVWVDKILSANHELALAYMQAEQQHTRVQRERLNKVPDPTIGLGYSREQSGTENLMGVSVSVPLSGRYTRIAVGMAAAEADKADYEIERVKKRLRQEAQYLSIQMESAQLRYVKTRQNLNQLQQQHNLMQKAYKLGELSLNELLLHAQQLVEARLRIDQAKVDYAESYGLLLLNSHQLWPLHDEQTYVDTQQLNSSGIH
ncbi:MULTISPECIES: TolC family protein [unclassified Acinetobacter]|uniref:TolC family protein n=1 Tax=unclassified Acinetobacter TaxID=196816 RepID=UPI0029352C76|nr:MULTISPECIES: TolC family protein [unclassified Acinetobacter]WOE31518.1 TolC family protein [Acinetobacter sp. SAAs470]WOE39714.1 TolC family protein [Acinetobacter sp. SAAs474]